MAIVASIVCLVAQVGPFARNADTDQSMTNQLVPTDWMSPGGDLGGYIQAVNNIPMLTPERERALAERLHFDGEVDAARELVLAHLRFVVYVAKSFSGYGLAVADLIQEGNVGLMKAGLRRPRGAFD